MAQTTSRATRPSRASRRTAFCARSSAPSTERCSARGPAATSAPTLLPQAEHVLHVVEAWIAVAQPLGCAHGAARERGARRGAMGDLEALAHAAEVGGVLADDVAAAHGQDADLVGRARAD